MVLDERKGHGGEIAEMPETLPQQVLDRELRGGLQIRSHRGKARPRDPGRGHVDNQPTGALQMPRHRLVGHPDDDPVASPAGRQAPRRILASLLEPQIPAALLIGIARDPANHPPAPIGGRIDYLICHVLH